MKVAIFFGSKSDTEIMRGAAKCLKEFGVEYKAFILSAHRVPEKLEEVLKEIEIQGCKVIIAGAGLAALALAAAKEEINSNSPAKETIKLGKYFGQGFEIGITDEEKAVGKASKKLADTALRSLDRSAVSNRMRETLSFNTGRIASSFALESSSTILKRQQVENAMKFSDSDIRKLADEFGIVAGQEFSERMEGMTFRAYDRDFARLVKEVQQP